MSDIVYCDERGEYPNCYAPRSVEEPAEDITDLDVVAWLKAEMMDGMLHAVAHEVDGPSFFGPDNFRVFRDPRSGLWLSTGKTSNK